MKKSWKTTTIGFGIIIAGIYVFVTTKDWTQSGIAVGVGIGLLFAKDNNVTGGTKAV